MTMSNKKNVLIVVDMQNDFITGPLGTLEAQAIVPAVVRLIRDGDYDAWYVTKDTHGKDYLNTHEGRYLPVEHCIERTDGWKLQKDVEEALEPLQYQSDEVFVSTIYKNGFGSAELVERLHFQGNVDRIDICGVCTDICVVSNALMLRSYLPETDIRVMADACAGTTPENHEAALRVMRMCHIDIVGGVMPSGE